MNAAPLSLVIPTRNHAPFLQRLLRYYGEVGCPYPILIGDASDDAHWEANRMAVESFRDRLSIFHDRHPPQEYPYPGLGLHESLTLLLQRVETKYSVWVADDDFVVPRGMGEAVQFLEQHPDYSTARGMGVIFRIDGELRGKFRWVGPYRQDPCHSEDVAERLWGYMTSGLAAAPAFSVKRTSQMRLQWETAHLLKLDNRFGESLSDCLTVIQGKVRTLDRLYLVRQCREQMTSRTTLGLEGLITHPNWSSQYERYHRFLAQALHDGDGIGAQEAKDLVEKAFRAHMACIMKRKHPQILGISMKRDLPTLARETAQRLPLLWQILQGIRPYLSGERHQLSLSSLLHPGSLYHADFMPIYRAMTQDDPS